jgi:ATP-dependent DNA helicase RecQ
MCDNCLAEPQESVDLTIPAQMFLSCVLRTKEMFGASYIVDVLRGSRNKRILGNGHDTLSTYNIGRDYSTAQWQALAGQFVEAGLLRRDMTHGGLSVTDDGWAVLRGRPFRGTAPEADVVTTGPQVDREYDRELFELLRATRTELAAKQGVPPYVIFSDRSLQEMAAFYPQTVEELLQIHGVGEAKLERYGAQMLGVVVGYCRSRGIKHQPRPLVVSREPSPRAPAGERRQEIAEQFNQGATIDAIAEAKGLSREAAISNLWRAAHFAPGLNPAYLCRELGLEHASVRSVLEADGAPDLDNLRRLYSSVHPALDGEADWLLRLLIANHTHRTAPSPAERQDIREAITAVVDSLPGTLPRTDLANLLRGQVLRRAAEYQDHPEFGRFPDAARFELIAVIDIMIDEGAIILEDRRLYPA